MHFRNAARVCAALLLSLCVSPTSLFAQTQSEPGLEVILTPLGAATGDKPLPVAADIEIDVKVKNTGSAALTKVALRAKLGGLKLSPDSEWQAQGDDAVIEIGGLAANGEVTRRLALRVEMAPLPPGRPAKLTVEAAAENIAREASVTVRIGDCAAAFQADLTRLRIERISEIWPTADGLRKQDTLLPRGRLFRIPARRGEFTTLHRIAAGYQARRLSDASFMDQGVRYTVRRWSDEMKAFAGQEPNPGICAVNDQMLQGIRRTIHYAAVRLEPPQKAFGRAIEQLRKELKAGDGDTLRAIALRSLEEAGAKIENPAKDTLQLLAQGKEFLKDRKLSDAQLDDLALLESVAWIEAQALRSKSLSVLIDGTIEGIAIAREKNCVCAF